MVQRVYSQIDVCGYEWGRWHEFISGHHFSLTSALAGERGASRNSLFSLFSDAIHVFVYVLQLA